MTCCCEYFLPLSSCPASDVVSLVEYSMVSLMTLVVGGDLAAEVGFDELMIGPDGIVVDDVVFIVVVDVVVLIVAFEHN